MSWLTDLFSIAPQRALGSPPPVTVRGPVPAPTRVVDTGVPRAAAGGRISIDNAFDQFTTWPVVLPPADAEDAWRLENLDSKSLDRMSPARLMELLADISPEVSRALWDFLRMCNPGWEATAFRPGTETKDVTAQAALDAFLTSLQGGYSFVVPLEVPIGRLFIGAFLRGAFMSELILSEDGRQPLDLATPDPTSARFQRRPDPVRGSVWQLGQYQRGGFVPLDRPTIAYVPIDPFPGKPYGRPMASAALFAGVFLLAMLHDLRRVVQQQGYPRIDIALDLEKLLETMPEADREDLATIKAWITDATDQVTTAYAALEPDDAYVHADSISINRPVGTVDASSLGAVDTLINALERMLTRSLKTTSFMMSLDARMSETIGNRAYEQYVQSIKAVQHLCENMLENLLKLGLAVQGIAADVRFRFAENRVAEMLRDAQVDNLTAQVAAYQYAQGWISQDEAAQKATGKAKADVPEPRSATATAPTNLVGGTVDPGASRAAAKQNGHTGKVDLQEYQEVLS